MTHTFIIAEAPKWRRVWCQPNIWASIFALCDGLNPPLSAQAKYKIQESKRRFLLRDDVDKDYFDREYSGEVGRIEGVRFIVTP